MTAEQPVSDPAANVRDFRRTSPAEVNDAAHP